ncbi:MAG: hypothetical protein U0736_13180 [Gemmataceae bacterium]
MSIRTLTTLAMVVVVAGGALAVGTATGSLRLFRRASRPDLILHKAKRERLQLTITERGAAGVGRQQGRRLPRQGALAQQHRRHHHPLGDRRRYPGPQGRQAGPARRFQPLRAAENAEDRRRPVRMPTL